MVAKEQRKKIHHLASAILQVAQMLDEEYLKAPLGEDEKEKKKRLKEEEKRKKVLKHIDFPLSPKRLNLRIVNRPFRSRPRRTPRKRRSLNQPKY